MVNLFIKASLFLVFAVFTNATAQSGTHKTSTFKVWGNCGTCKKTIEASLKVKGVEKADWNVKTKMITVTYDESKITLDQIQKHIAAVGYDNDKYKGDDKAYAKLPGCCQYERK